MAGLCHSINLHKFYDLFSHPFSTGSCPTCSVEFPSREFGVHMHLLCPTDPHHVHGFGESLAEAQEDACANAVVLLESLDDHFFELRKARLRVRLSDFSMTCPTTEHMMLLQQNEDDDSNTHLPKQFVDLVAAIGNEEVERQSGEVIEALSEKLLASVGSWKLEEVESVFAKIGLSLCDEMNQAMNPFLFATIVTLFLRVDLNAIEADERIKLSFCKIMEQVLIFNIGKIWCGDAIIGRLIRYFCERRSVPFMAKNRMEAIGIQLSPGGKEMAANFGVNNANTVEDDLEKIIASKTPPQEYLDSLLFEFGKVNQVIKSLFNVDGSVYGSLVNGFPTTSSDIDVVINLPGYDEDVVVVPDIVDDEQVEGEEEGEGGNKKNLTELNLLYDGIKEAFGDEYTLSKIESARVPILIVKKGNVEINLSFNHQVVIHNSELLKAYSSISPRVRELVVLVKFWAKQREINDSLQGSLSSYSYVLLVIGFLQKRGFLPDLQNPEFLGERIVPSRITDNKTCSTWFLQDGWEGVSFATEFASYTDRLSSASLTFLLAEFFKFYLYDFNYITDVMTVSSVVLARDVPEPLSVKKGEKYIKKHDYFVTKNSDGGALEVDFRALRKRTWFTIVDPFEIGRCLGTSARGSETIVKDMRRAVDLLSRGEVAPIFDEYKRRERTTFPAFPTRQLNKRDPFECYLRPVQKHFDPKNLSVLEGIRTVVNQIKSPHIVGSSDSSSAQFRVLCYLSKLGLPREAQLAELGVSFDDTGALKFVPSVIAGLMKNLAKPQPVPGYSHEQANGPAWMRPANRGPPPPPPHNRSHNNPPPPPPQVRAPGFPEVRNQLLQHHPDHRFRPQHEAHKADDNHNSGKAQKDGKGHNVGKGEVKGRQRGKGKANGHHATEADHEREGEASGRRRKGEGKGHSDGKGHQRGKGQGGSKPAISAPTVSSPPAGRQIGTAGNI